MEPLAPGLYRVHKPVGPTSRAVMETLRAPGSGKMCHGGALDPFAQGLLLVLIGEATKLFPSLHAVPKVYEAELRWGVETDNGDLLGRETARGDPGTLSPGALEAALTPFLGWRDQVPPTTSNKRIDGERAYQKAHRGEVFELPPSRAYLHSATWMRHDLPRRSWLRISVAGGFYVRALARDLGRALGVYAHLGTLDRRSIGPWEDPGSGRVIGVRGEALLPWCPARSLTDEERADLAPGGALPRGALRAPAWRVPEGFPAPPVRLLAEGRLVGVARDGDPLAVELALRWGV